MDAISMRRQALSGRAGETLSETVYRTLLDMIVFGQFESMPRLLPAELATLLNVSQTPVREALARLASDGYLEAIPRRGFHIRKPTKQMVLETWQLRQGLELTAGELLIGRLKDGQLKDENLDEVRQIQEQVENSFSNADSQQHTQLNSEFHRLIVRMSGNSLLFGIYESAQTQLLRAWVKRGSSRWTGRGEIETGEHRAIITSLEQHDVEAYAAAVRRHIGRSMADAISDLDNARS